MKTEQLLDRALSIVLTIAAVAAAAVLVEGRLNPPAAASTARRVEKLKDWEDVSRLASIALGELDRPVKLEVFTDFECPFCARMDSVISKLEEEYPRAIGRHVIHFPIPSHANAMNAARVFQCAAVQGRASEMHHLLYANQAAFARSPWLALAVEARVPDIQKFDACHRGTEQDMKIGGGVDLAERFSISSTPSVVINGWLVHPATPEAISKSVTAAVAGRSPKP